MENNNKNKIKNVMETLIYKRDYGFVFAIKFFYHVNYYESVWGEKNIRIYRLETEVGEHRLRLKYTSLHDLSHIKVSIL